MGNVFSPAHPNNMTDTSPSGQATDEDVTTPGTADTVTPGGQTGDQDDLPDDNALDAAGKASTTQA